MPGKRHGDLIQTTVEVGRSPTSPFIIGADISWVQQQEAEGIKWSDDGAEKDIFAILKAHGFNWIRLRIFVNPEVEGGYSKEGFCDLEHTLQMAKRVKAAGMRLLLDFHYSDTWADPAHQRKPAVWVDLHGDDLEKAVRDYTRDVILALKRQETIPDMVQIGNEISHGMLWPDGKMWETNTEVQGPSGGLHRGRIVRSRARCEATRIRSRRNHLPQSGSRNPRHEPT